MLLVQRIVRSMHPQIGWSKPFSYGTSALAISVPFIIINNITAVIGSFLSVGKEEQIKAFEGMLKFGNVWNLFLVTFPFWVTFLACSFPGPRPEKFGVGSLRTKTSLILFSSTLLSIGTIVRFYAIFNPQPLDTTNVLFLKPVFYVTQFTMEFIVVALYALLRFDKLFHIPNGAHGYGSYSKNIATKDAESGIYTRQFIEDRIAQSGVPHQILSASYSQTPSTPGAEQPVYAIFYPQSSATEVITIGKESDLARVNTARTADRVSRRQGQSARDAIGVNRRPSMRESMQMAMPGGLPGWEVVPDPEVPEYLPWGGKYYNGPNMNRDMNRQ